MRTPEQNERRRLLILSLEAKRQLYCDKADRARKYEISHAWHLKYQTVFRILMKAYAPLVPYGFDRFGQSDTWRQNFNRERWAKHRAQRIEEGKKRFLTSYTYSLWFLSNSTTADYGEFECDSCGRTFYHSPSTIRKAGKLVYNCCCGRCTNELITPNPYD